MKMAIASIFINFFVSLTILFRDEISIKFLFIFFIIMQIFIVLSIIGLIGYYVTKKKAFGIIATIGFAVFVPIGLIGAYGMRKMIDEEKEKQFISENNKDSQKA